MAKSNVIVVHPNIFLWELEKSIKAYEVKLQQDNVERRDAIQLIALRKAYNTRYDALLELLRN